MRAAKRDKRRRLYRHNVEIWIQTEITHRGTARLKKKKRSNDLKYHLPPLLSWNRLASIRPADRTQTELLPSPIRYNSRPEHWAKETGGEVEKLKTLNYSTGTCFHEGYLNNFLLT